MTRKPFALRKEDPVVQQFNSGLEAWERPFDTPGAAEKIRTRGTVKTRGGVQPRGGAKLRAFTLPEDDPVLGQFRTGLDNWERPFEKKR